MKYRLKMILVASAAVAFALTMATGTVAAASTPALKSKLLTVSNLPAGWAVDKQKSRGGVTANGCFSGLITPVKHGQHATVAFIHGEVPLLAENVATGPSEVTRYKKLVKTLSACKTISFSIGGQTISGSVGALSFPTEGNSSHAYSLTLSDQGVTLSVDYILFREGPYEGLVEYADLGTPDIRQAEGFVTEAIAKLTGGPVIPPAPNPVHLSAAHNMEPNGAATDLAVPA